MGVRSSSGKGGSGIRYMQHSGTLLCGRGAEGLVAKISDRCHGRSCVMSCIGTRSGAERSGTRVYGFDQERG